MHAAEIQSPLDKFSVFGIHCPVFALHTGFAVVGAIAVQIHSVWAANLKLARVHTTQDSHVGGENCQNDGGTKRPCIIIVHPDRGGLLS